MYFYFKDDPSSPGGGISDNELKEIFADGWKIESIKAVSQDNDEWKMNFAEITERIKNIIKEYLSVSRSLNLFP